MKLVHAGVAMLTAGAALVGCESRTVTPKEVEAAYTELVSSLDPAAPGLSLLRLQEFARRQARYDLTARLDPQIEAWRARLQSAYLEARDLAREGRFDQAEWMLKDLALVPDEPAGKQAMQFLVFDFHKLKATRLLATGDAAGAEAAAKTLVTSDLGEQDMAEAQQLLDVAATAKLGARMVRTTALQSSARALHVFLLSYYMDYGQYPDRLSLDASELSFLRDSGSLGAIGSLEHYEATRDTFSVVVTGRESTHRVRVTHRGIETLPAIQ